MQTGNNSRVHIQRCRCHGHFGCPCWNCTNQTFCIRDICNQFKYLRSDQCQCKNIVIIIIVIGPTFHKLRKTSLSKRMPTKAPISACPIPATNPGTCPTSKINSANKNPVKIEKTNVPPGTLKVRSNNNVIIITITKNRIVQALKFVPICSATGFSIVGCRYPTINGIDIVKKVIRTVKCSHQTIICAILPANTNNF